MSSGTWDLWEGNALVRDGEIVCVIDHERALFGDPLIEVGFAGLLSPSFGDSTAFPRGYGRGSLTECVDDVMTSLTRGRQDPAAPAARATAPGSARAALA